MKKLIDDQLIAEGNYKFCEEFEEFETIGNTPRTVKKRKNPYDNVTTQKRKLLPITSEDRLKALPSLYSEIPTDQSKKVEAAKKVFDKFIKQVAPTYKKFKINYDKKNDITIDEWNKC